MIFGRRALFTTLFLVGCLLSNVGFAQFSKIKDIYQDGEDFFQAEDYKEAIFYFLQVEEKGFVSSNLKYKIGICYLNLPGEETRAIPYLEEASRHISLKYSPKTIQERQAPLHTLYYLGNAYRIDNQLSKALDAYRKFTAHPGYDGNYNLGVVESEIKACERAKIIQDSPIKVNWQNLGAPINSPTSETKPVISGDEQVLVYLTTLKFYNAIYVSKKVAGAWGPPENINPQILSDGEFYPAALSFTGTELYLVKKGQGNMDIYSSTFENGKWSIAKPLSKNINSSSDENAASITQDGKTLYFSSNRSGSKGYDIYRSVLGPDNQWSKPENLGKVINTKEDDSYPSISPDGKVLYFSSKGHYNMGGYDIFYSLLQKDGKWTPPSNIGYPINTTNDNVGFQTIGDGTTGYISRLAPDGLGKEDIFRVEILEKYNQKETTESE